MTERRRVLCRLCGHQTDTTRTHAWYAAIDHLLDAHRDRLLTNPDRVRVMVSIAKPVGMSRGVRGA